MAWRREGDRPSTELMMVSLLTHLCATRRHWVEVYVHYHDIWFYNFLVFPYARNDNIYKLHCQSLLHSTGVVSVCIMPLRWRHNGRDSLSNHHPHDCLLNRLFRRRSKKTSKLRVTGLCAGNSPGTGEFPTQMASNAENFPFDVVIMP